MYSVMVLKVLGQLITSFPWAVTQTTRHFVSFWKKDSITGLEVTLQSSSLTFQVPGDKGSLLFVRTQKTTVLTECC